MIEKCLIENCYKQAMVNGYCLPCWNGFSQEDRTKITIKTKAYGKWSIDDLTNTMLNAIDSVDSFRGGYVRPGDPVFSETDMRNIETFGIYFPPKDRCFYAGIVDGRNDGMIDEATLAILGNRDFLLEEGSKIEDMLSVGQEIANDRGFLLDIFHVKKINKLPKNFICMASGQPYSVSRIIYSENYNYLGYLANRLGIKESKINEGGFFVLKSVIKIDYENDNISVAYRFQDQKDNKFLSSLRFSTKHYAAMAISAEADKKNLWIVRGFRQEERKLFGNIVFGVYPEHIQALFFARDLPLTDTGRKNPILHWVSAHKKLSKLGKPVEIDEYLRGTEQLIIGDMTFLITDPHKNEDREPFHLWARKNYLKTQ